MVRREIIDRKEWPMQEEKETLIILMGIRKS